MRNKKIHVIISVFHIPNFIHLIKPQIIQGELLLFLFLFAYNFCMFILLNWCTEDCNNYIWIADFLLQHYKPFLSLICIGFDLNSFLFDINIMLPSIFSVYTSPRHVSAYPFKISSCFWCMHALCSTEVLN